MEHIKAFEALQKKSKKLGLKVLADHIKNVGPLKIKTSRMEFVPHLVKIIVGQQLSVQSAAAIWKRTELILKENNNISFFKDISEINSKNSFVFNSVPSIKKDHRNLWQHFCGVEVETKNDFFDDEIFNLMDFDCDQRESVHFFYTLPYSKTKALIETTWLSKMNDDSQKDYDTQIKDYIENHLNLKDYKIIYKEEGAIPLFYPINEKVKNKINIGTAGGMTRLSTGYTFLNIQEHSRYIRENIENITHAKKYKIGNKYQFLDEIFLRVLEKHPEKMPEIFFKMFKASPKTVIKFLSNKSNFFEDLSIIFRMPKLTFIKALFY